MSFESNFGQRRRDVSDIPSVANEGRQDASAVKLRGRDESHPCRVVDMGDRIITEYTPRHSSALNPAQAAVKQVKEQARVFKPELEMRGMRVTANDVLWTWLCRHAARLTRCGRRAGGHSRPTSLHLAYRIGETWHDALKQCCSALLILTIDILRRIVRCTRVKPSGAEPSGLANLRNRTISCSSRKMVWIVLALSRGWRRKTTTGARSAWTTTQATGHAGRSDSRTSCWRAIASGGSESRMLHNCVRKAAPDQAMPLVPLALKRDHDSDALQHTNARRVMLVCDLDVGHVGSCSHSCIVFGRAGRVLCCGRDGNRHHRYGGSSGQTFVAQGCGRCASRVSSWSEAHHNSFGTSMAMASCWPALATQSLICGEGTSGNGGVKNCTTLDRCQPRTS